MGTDLSNWVGAGGLQPESIQPHRFGQIHRQKECSGQREWRSSRCHPAAGAAGFVKQRCGSRDSCACKYLGGLRRGVGSQLKVSFKIIDDWTDGAAALATDNVDVMLTTVDVYAKDYAQFKEKGFGSHAFLIVDWSRGADGVIGKQGINSIEDLAGKTIAFAPYTPSHFLLWNGLKTSGLDSSQRNEIFNKAIHTKDGIEPATLFAQEKVDAAVAWDPDMSDAVAKRPGAKKIYDTKVANRLIADILVVSDSFSAKHPQTLLKFAQGWLEGVEFIKTQQ